MQNKIKHLEFIQKVISRMAGNLFFLKGWAVTLIAGILTLSTSVQNSKFTIIAFFLTIVFWILDGYFLSQERTFRDLYEDVSKLKEKDIDFSMKVDKYKKYYRNSWVGSTFSPTLILFYCSLILALLISRLLVTENKNAIPHHNQCSNHSKQQTPNIHKNKVLNDNCFYRTKY